jgi:type I restriction enzyme S subunit
LGDLVEEGGIYNGPRFARIDCQSPHGLEFMSQRDAMLIRPVPRRIVHPGFADRQLFAREGTILVGGHGTLGEGEIFGRAVLVHGRFARAAFTQDLLRIVPKPTEAHALYAYLTTTVGFRLLRTTAVGTKILSMREDMLRALPVPEWPVGLQSNVANLIRSAFAARDEADGSEAEAVRIIEEEVLPQWLA